MENLLKRGMIEMYERSVWKLPSWGGNSLKIPTFKDSPFPIPRSFF